MQDTNRRSLWERIRSRRRNRGQSLVEFALVLPLMLFLLAMAIDFGRLFYTYVAVENAAKEGAIYGAQNPICATDANAVLCPDPQNVEWRVLNEAANLPGLQVSTIECRERASGTAYGDLRSCKDGDTYVVGTTFDFRLVTPILSAVLGNGLTLQSESQSKVLNEAFDPTPGAAVMKYVCVGAGCTDFEQTPTIDVNDQPVYVEATAGETLVYRISVTNIGGQALTATSIADTYGALPFGAADCPALPATLARNQTWSCAYPRTAPNPPGGNPDHLVSNTVTFDAAEIEPVPQTAIVKVLARPAEFLVTKHVNVFREGGDGDGTPGGFGNATSSTIYQPGTGSASIWYWLLVRNTGGQNATGTTVTDTFGALPVNADCPAPPATFAPNQLWGCFYQRTFTGGVSGTFSNTIRARADNVTVDGNDDATATVTVNSNASCSGTDRVVPNLMGLTKAAATTAWTTTAGFTGALTTWSGHTSAPVVTQNRTPFSCLARTSTAVVTWDGTP